MQSRDVVEEIDKALARVDSPFYPDGLTRAECRYGIRTAAAGIGGERT
jgi:hypothetical protein